jgi:hypothetical protein
VELTQEILDGYKGGQFEIQNTVEGYLYRGDVTEIGVNSNNSVEITFAWLAKGEGFPPFPTGWVNDTNLRYAASLEIYSVSDIGDGRLCLMSPIVDETTVLYPPNGSKLSTREVKGLPKDSARLLALFPDLPFDRAVVEQVCRDQVWPSVLEKLPTLPTSATVNDVLALFRNDSGAEEFLWHYIEAVTDEQNVHQRVY